MSETEKRKMIPMLPIRPLSRKNERNLCPWERTRLMVAFIVGVGCLIDAGIASAAEAAASQVQMRFPVAQIFLFLFLMLGPFKIIGPFSRVTKGANPAFIRQLAVRTTFFSGLALLLAALLGGTMLSNFGIPVLILSLSGGIILLLVALKSILEQFSPATLQSEEVAALPSDPARVLKLALTPLAFPTVVTPYGIAALVVFLALSPDLQTRLTIGAIVLVIMASNLIIMLSTRYLLPIMGLALPILAAVLGVVQVALGLQIINNSLRALRVL
jgi:small neutral amino acid transporter SnatA (MarC family)